MSATNVKARVASGSTGQASLLDAVRELLTREESDQAEAGELVSLLDKAQSLAATMKANGLLRGNVELPESLTALTAPERTRKARLDKSVKQLRIRLKVLEFVLQNLGRVYDAEAWYQEVSTFISNADDGALVELRTKVAGLPALQRRLFGDFDEDAAAKLRDKLRREEKDLRSRVEAAFRFFRAKKVVIFNQQSSKITHAERV